MIDNIQEQGVLSPRGGSFMQFVGFIATLAASLVSVVYGWLNDVWWPLAALAGAVALVAALYYGARGLIWYIGWQDSRRIGRERHYADMLAADTAAAVARLDAETRRIEALKIDSDGRQTIILDGVTLARNAASLTAPLNHAMPVNVPHTYSPRIEISNAAAPPALAAPATATAALAPLDLATALDPGAGRGVLLAQGEDGKLIYTPANRLCNVALAGSTGGGKTSIMRLLLTQLLAGGAHVMLADPHFTPYDAENNEDWRPIAEKLAAPPAYRASDIETLIRWIATEELPRRLEARRTGQKVGKPLFLAIDELPALVKRVPDAPAWLGEILREGRKVGIMTISAAQDFLVKTIGGDSAVRDCYRTAFFTGGDETSARVLLDIRARQGVPIDDGTLGKGAVLVRAAGVPATRARIPYLTNNDLYRVLGSSALAPSIEAPLIEQPTEQPIGEILIADAGRVVSLDSWRAARGGTIKATAAASSQNETASSLDRQPPAPALTEEQRAVLEALNSGITGARAIGTLTGINRNRVTAIVDGLALAGLYTGECGPE